MLRCRSANSAKSKGINTQAEYEDIRHQCYFSLKAGIEQITPKMSTRSQRAALLIITYLNALVTFLEKPVIWVTYCNIKRTIA